MTRRSGTFVALLGGVLALVVGGIGSPAASASAGSGSGSGANSAKLSAAVQAQAQRDLLQPSDFPADWVVGAAAAAPSRTSPWSKKLASCSGVRSALAAIKPTKISGSEYTSGDHTLAVEDSISVYATAAQAKAAWKAMANPKTPTCMNRIGSQALRTSVQNEAGSGATVGSVHIAGLAKGTYEAGQTGYSVSIPLVSGGRQLTITSTEIEFVRGRFDHQLTFNGNGVTFPPLLEVHLVRQVEGRS
ncbi:MAG TPA: hypothetical protein VG244_02235 [Acidimicrobiales bacterium]|nr:hypothetical protein [Acidimicrobiales bacterium]